MPNKRMSIKDKNGEKYILEYNRETVAQIERLGFSIDRAGDSPAMIYPLIFRGAFLVNHKYLKDKDITEIYESMPRKKDLMEEIMNMILECYETLIDNSETSEGNADWEME